MADATGPKKTRVQSALFMCNFNAVRSRCNKLESATSACTSAGLNG